MLIPPYPSYDTITFSYNKTYCTLASWSWNALRAFNKACDFISSASVLVDQCNVGNSITNDKNLVVQCRVSDEKTQTWQGSFILKYKVYLRCFLRCAWQNTQCPTQKAPPFCHSDKQAQQLKAWGIWCMHKYSTAQNYLGICHGSATVKTQIQHTVWPRWNLVYHNRKPWFHWGQFPQLSFLPWLWFSSTWVIWQLFRGEHDR